MPSVAKEVPLEVDDRVIVSIDNVVTKGRVAAVLPFNKVKVTLSKDDEGKVYDRSQIYPLYRYVPHPTMPGVVGIVPLMAM